MEKLIYAKKLKHHEFRLWQGKRSLLGQLDIELTERCNNNCIHCCINLPEDDAYASSQEMGTDFFKDIITQTADWWEKELTLIEKIGKEVPCYRILFDKSGKVIEQIKAL